MRNSQQENIQEHSHQTAVIAHCLAVLRNARHGGNVDVNRVTTLAVFHEVSEVITGDLPTPIKYYNAHIQKAYKDIERYAGQNLYDMLPADLAVHYRELIFQPEDENHQLVKAADKLCAYLKCVEEMKSGNQEFAPAAATIRRSLDSCSIPEVQDFLDEFLPSYSLTLDQLNEDISD